MAYIKDLNAFVDKTLEQVSTADVGKDGKEIITNLLREFVLRDIYDNDAMVNILELFNEKPRKTKAFFQVMKDGLVKFRTDIPEAHWWDDLGGFPEDRQERTVFFT